MFNARHPYRPRLPNRPIVGYGQPISPINLLWKSTWPYKISNIIATLLILLALVLIALEIAFVAKMGGASTASAYTSGVGIWCGVFILIAGIVILVINCVKNVHILTLVSFGFTILATCFAIIAFSINAYRVQFSVQYNLFSISGFPEPSLAAAELAVAIVAFLVCLAFICIYIRTAIIISRKRKGQQKFDPIQRA
ncbi:unnamed protein product [Rotaria socialis]|uniref:Uncharacterized protein n=1 Tax=Rotaria socialis TaxID=392032 RepID=A0A820UC77_9BILA|nr:unnamed protein product [Rotaria socialis]CAF3424997.1 unnamed protein product [Rotaria socialis]CAF3512776.1 unnamed protein product [Rotaria socialis]CAF3559434.1 unnamed protein product [Rotaria socialis]CAF4160610.1 unnamed protein product [Rotaria socialis]